RLQPGRPRLRRRGLHLVHHRVADGRGADHRPQLHARAALHAQGILPNRLMGPALALVELASIARGHRVAHAMCKRAPIGLMRADWVSPGKYLVLVEGDVAAVDEAFAVGVDVAGSQLLDRLILQQPHAEIWPALAGEANAKAGVESLGIVETKTVAATVR